MVLTSCNRPDELLPTLTSFFKFNTYPIKKIIIIDDSGINNCIDTCLSVIPKNIETHVIYNETNLGQIASIDKAYSLVDTEYIFHCEDDWEFYNYGFIEKSMEILSDNEKIFTVWLREYKNFRVVQSGHPVNVEIHKGKYRLLNVDRETGRPENIWGGFTFNPGLRRLNDCKIFMPYSQFINSPDCHSGGVEQALSVNYINEKFYAAIPVDETGYVKHIGFENSTQNIANKNKLLSRSNTSSKIKIYYDKYTNYMNYKNIGEPITNKEIVSSGKFNNFEDYLKLKYEEELLFDENIKTKILNQNEYIMIVYINSLYEYLHIHKNDNKMIEFVEDKNIAEIEIIKITEQSLTLYYKKYNKNITFGCDIPCQGVYADVLIPYFTGIYTNNISSLQTYNYNYTRNYLLCFIGGLWRNSINRTKTINNLMKYNEQNDKYFHVPLITYSHEDENNKGWDKGTISSIAKKGYTDSVFSWQPSGDTSTRRGFYEAMLLGNIPVISESSYNIYKKLKLNDILNLNKIAIVIDNLHFYDADYLIKYLNNISVEEINTRRFNIEKIANHLQWGLSTHANILSDILSI
jgi:hypothetical protein